MNRRYPPTIIVLFLFLLCSLLVSPSMAYAKKLLLLYSNDVQGELEPCG